jgi:tRNA(Ile2) C34 agmatinyltransferase TiaS
MTTPRVPIVEDVNSCPRGGGHEWAYLGIQVQGYRCSKCGGQATKARLKRETEAGQPVDPGVLQRRSLEEHEAAFLSRRNPNA